MKKQFVLFILFHSLVLFSFAQEKKPLSDAALLDKVERQTFNYFWDGAEPNSGMAPERIHTDNVYPENDQSTIATGGSGFGCMAILAGIHRGYIQRTEGLRRFVKIVSFLEKADRFHGAWPHWINDQTAHVKPFGSDDNGGDLVETCYLMQGLLCVRQYFKDGNEEERRLSARIDVLWRGVDFNWYRNGGQNVLLWHWSPTNGWKMNFPVHGYNECLILYVMAASSPTSHIPAAVYDEGWAQNGAIDKISFYGTDTLHLHMQGDPPHGGPLFWAHYSWLGLNPHGLKDKYADYWKEDSTQAIINYKWCVNNPKHFKGYGKDNWGLTASYSVDGYAAHAPDERNDLGVISPTAAISSLPYTPGPSMAAIRHWYEKMGDRLWGKYGFYDAFSESAGWYPQRYLAIDQGPEVAMIENYRSGLLWRLFMSCPEVRSGLKKLGFESPAMSPGTTAQAPAYTAVSAPASQEKMHAFVGTLMSRMTLDEKIGQLNLPSSGDFTTGQATNSDIAKKIAAGQVGGLFNIKSVAKIREVQRIAVENSRLKIPLIFGMDVIHGYETVFPIPLGLSCSWDMAAIEKSARVAATEASADGICWTFSPMVDIARDPRWGRIAEGNGEDPYLGSQIARAMVKGYQGDLSGNTDIMACVKHFALYGAAEAGRDYNTTDMSNSRMFNEYLSPYKAAVDAGVGSIMASFNDVNGIPATANKFLQTDVLRGRWGFTGLDVTDYTGINEMIEHGMGDLQTVAALALRAGMDMDMVGEGFLTTLKKSVQEGKVTVAQIDAACRRVLEAKYKLGLFNDPYKYCNEGRAATEIFTAANRATARSIAADCFVLLKNQGNILPLKKGGTIAVVGPLGNNKENMTGTWSVAADFSKSVSLLQGLKDVAGDGVHIVYSQGSNLDADSLFTTRAGMFGKPIPWDTRPAAEIQQDALKAAAGADVIVAALGESAEMTGESSSRSNIEIPQAQQDLLQALLKTGKPVVLVLFTGRPLAIKWEDEQVPAILNVWFGGTEAGHAIADVLFGDTNPSGKLSTTWPQNVGQVPLYYNHMNTGRPLAEGAWFQKFRSNYLDVSNDPVYPFGYGLSYTHFTYSNLELSSASIKGDQPLTVTVTVTNDGSRAGKEVVQLYIRDLVGSITRPVKELKGFQKITLKAGESRKVEFTIRTADLKFYNNDLKYDWEPGDFVIMTGGNSRDVLSAKLHWSR